MVIVGLAHATGSRRDSVNGSFSSRCCGRLSDTSWAVPYSLSARFEICVDADLPMVVVRLTAYAGSSVCILSHNGRSNGEKDRGKSHFGVRCVWYIVATEVVLRMYKDSTGYLV